MNVVVTVLKFNLQWYGRVMRDILFRYKILILFCILLVCPTLASLFNLLTIPLESLFSYPVTNVMSLCGALFFYQVFGVIWISIHYVALFKQPWQKYLTTLPLSKSQKKLIDISLLLFVDIIMWVPLLLTSIKSISVAYLLKYSIALVLAKCIVFISIILLAQISFVRSKRDIWAAILLIDLFAIFSAIFLGQLSQLILMLFLMPIIYILISSCYEDQVTKSVAEKSKFSVCINSINYKKSVPMLRIQIKNLIEQSSQLTLLFSVILTISLIAIVLMIYGKTNPLLPFFLSITMLINSLSASNVFKCMHDQWKGFYGYVGSLPISKILLFKNDLMIASSIAGLFNMVIIFVGVLLCGYDLVIKIIPAFLLGIIFLVASYIPQIKFRRFGFFVSICLMFIFLYVDYLLI